MQIQCMALEIAAKSVFYIPVNWTLPVANEHPRKPKIWKKEYLNYSEREDQTNEN